MKCPICTNVDLVMSERQGVEIDYCPNCRGIWLDRGELDKIIEKASTFDKVNPSASQPYNTDRDYKRHNSDGYYKHRHKNWLSDLFD